MADGPSLRQRLGRIRIGIRKDLHFSRQVLHGKVYYVVHDPVTFQSHIFDLDEYEVISSILPKRSLEESFGLLIESEFLTEEDEDEFFEFVLGLHAKNLLLLPLTNADRLYKRYVKKKALKRIRPIAAMMYLRVPVWDPDAFLKRTMRYARPLFSKLGFFLWMALFAFALWKVWGRFGEMSHEMQSLLGWRNLPMLYVALIGLKALHEFGHAFACRIFGGEVPEMGIVFILTAPCAYVDASASWKFPSPLRRIIVGLAGMYVESIIGAFSLLVWASTEGGVVHSVALNVVVLSTATTVFFNINPLMRFDGYYIFSDLIRIPNLRERSMRHLKSWFQRVFLRLDLEQIPHTIKETLLYSGYGVAAFIYKFTLAFSITAMVLIKWPVLGSVLVFVFGWMMLVRPVIRLLRFLWEAEELDGVRARARSYALGITLGLPLAVLYMPISTQLVAPGILEAEFQEVLRAPEAGFARELHVTGGKVVQGGDLLLALSQTLVSLELDRAREQVEAQRRRLEMYEGIDEAESRKASARLDYLVKRQRQVERKLAALEIRAPRKGSLSMIESRGLEGRFVQQGEELFTLGGGVTLIHAILPEEERARALLDPGNTVELRLASRPGERILAVVRELRPLATKDSLPPALTALAGGSVLARSNRRGKLVSAKPYVHLYLEPVTPLESGMIGMTAKVQIPARVRTLGMWLKRRALSLYNVWKMS